MNDRKTFVLATGVLVLVVAVVGALWLTTGDSRTATAGDRVEATRGPPPSSLDTAREPIPIDREAPVEMTVYMSPQCGCCGFWVDHVKEHGFAPEVHHQADMGEVKRTFRVPWELSSCHTAVVNGYIIEGHVPGEDIRRFLAEAPEARGLAVPGMPAGSPGMEIPDGRMDAYEVLLLRPDGATEVFARYGPRAPTR